MVTFGFENGSLRMPGKRGETRVSEAAGAGVQSRVILTQW